MELDGVDHAPVTQRRGSDRRRDRGVPDRGAWCARARPCAGDRPVHRHLFGFLVERGACGCADDPWQSPVCASARHARASVSERKVLRIVVASFADHTVGWARKQRGKYQSVQSRRIGFELPHGVEERPPQSSVGRRLRADCRTFVRASTLHRGLSQLFLTRSTPCARSTRRPPAARTPGWRAAALVPLRRNRVLVRRLGGLRFRPWLRLRR